MVSLPLSNGMVAEGSPSCESELRVSFTAVEANSDCARGHPARRLFRFVAGASPIELCLRHSLTFRPVALTALKTAAVVGTVLTAINQGNVLLAGHFPATLWWKIPLTYCVLYCSHGDKAAGGTRPGIPGFSIPRPAHDGSRIPGSAGAGTVSGICRWGGAPEADAKRKSPAPRRRNCHRNRPVSATPRWLFGTGGPGATP
jgi:hypothetical protein